MFSKIMKLFKKNRMLILVIIISIIVCFACCYFMRFSNKTESYTSQLGKEMVFFSMKGCGHCEKMMPAWKQLVSNYGSENAYIELKLVDADERPDLIEKYDIQSFPTILALKDGEISQKFSEPNRSYESLLRFMNYAMTN